jgi:hypothetical protein
VFQLLKSILAATARLTRRISTGVDGLFRRRVKPAALPVERKRPSYIEGLETREML